MPRKLKKLKRKEQDSPWKEIIEKFFKEFLQFFFPKIYKDIDFSRGYEFLDKELFRIVKDSNIGKRYADKLVKVYLKNGKETWLLIHIEVQGYRENNFPERIYIYQYKIFDKYHKEVICLVILTDKDENYRPDTYEKERWGFSLSFKFPVVKLIDYRGKEEELEKSQNPFAMVVLAFLKSLEEEENEDSKFRTKLSLIRKLYEKGYNKKEVQNLFKFIDWVISLSEEYENKIAEEVLKLEEVKKMPYVSTLEKLAEERGKKEGEKRGIEKGKKEGIKEGKKRAKIEIAKSLLQAKVNIDIIVISTGLTIEEIKSLKYRHLL